jgi:hypothetical protein
MMSRSTKKVRPQKKRGRPYAGGRDPIFSLRMPPELRKQTEAMAEEEGITLSKGCGLTFFLDPFMKWSYHNGEPSK